MSNFKKGEKVKVKGKADLYKVVNVKQDGKYTNVTVQKMSNNSKMVVLSTQLTKVK